jgi:AAA+ superfamily predicted ATPase
MTKTIKTEATRSQGVAADVAALLRARNPLLWVVTREEARVEKYLFEAAASAGYLARTWDIAQGVANISGRVENDRVQGDPDGALDAIKEKTGERGVWIMRDLPTWLQGPQMAITLRRLRNLARWLPGQPRDNAQAIIVISPNGEVPPELAGHATVIEWPLPDRAEIAALLDATVKSLPEELQKTAVNGQRDAAIDAAVGLSGEEAQATFARSLVQTRKVDPATIASEKKRVVAREGVLEWFDPIPGGLDAVGGLDNLKGWLISRAAAYSPQAREYGLPAPKGAMLVGVPGCGKSLTAKAIATAWGVPLLRLDLGALKSKYVGESEGNLRKALNVIAAIGRCVVWLDEIEKALAGSTGESGDGGVSADALGTILSWMQDRQGEAFVIATANNAEKLPPELLRKGRFDEIWWVDLPDFDERVAITAASLRAFGRDAGAIDVDLAAIADATDTFTGAELAAIVPDALFGAFADDAREIATDDLLQAAKVVVPLAKQQAEKIKALREFWLGRARPASNTRVRKEDASVGTPARALDL